MLTRTWTFSMLWKAIFLLGTLASPAPDAYMPLSITVWDKAGCKGNSMTTSFDPVAVPYGQDTHTTLVGASIKLSRPLSKQEQLDLSSTDSIVNWKEDLSYRETSCYIFQKSYFASDKMTGCVDTQWFMCLRLWRNLGLS